MKGFTIIEILITLSLAVTLALGGVLAFGRVRREEELRAIGLKFVEMVEKARNKSLTGDTDREWKIVVGAETLSLRDSEDRVVEDYRLTEGYRLVGPTGELNFARVSGAVAECASECVFRIEVVGGSLNYQINILNSGVVEY